MANAIHPRPEGQGFSHYFDKEASLICLADMSYFHVLPFQGVFYIRWVWGFFATSSALLGTEPDPLTHLKYGVYNLLRALKSLFDILIFKSIEVYPSWYSKQKPRTYRENDNAPITIIMTKEETHYWKYHRTWNDPNDKTFLITFNHWNCFHHLL